MRFELESGGAFNYWHIPGWTERGLVHGWSDRTLNGTVDCSALKEQFAVELLVKLKQEHGTEILSGNQWGRLSDLAYRDWFKPDDWPAGDGWLIEPRGLTGGRSAFVVRSADCFPVIIVDFVRNVSLNLHCGWRGVVGNLLTKGLRQLEAGGSDLSKIEIGIGPGLRSCCFEIRGEVTEQVRVAGREWGVDVIEFGDEGVTCGDLPKILRAQAETLGVPQGSIFELKICTVCDHRFFSYRRNPDDPGRQVTFVVS